MISPNKAHVLITGGAGYIGSTLVPILLASGFRVRVLDCLNFGGRSIATNLNHPNFEFQLGDIRKKSDLKKALESIDAVVHLAAIVGDPACSKEPELCEQTNTDASKLLFNMACEKNVERFVFASTCSNYGRMSEGGFVDENSPLQPVSLYAETKVAFEQFLLGHKSSSCIPTVLRFATVYGLAPRPRFDLTVNEFTRDAALGRDLVIYGEQFWRPYCHVVDLARSVQLVLDANSEAVAFETFNVGKTEENYTKGMIVEEIRKQIPALQIKFVQKDEDPRDYRVNFDKINRVLGYQISHTVPEGISQIADAIQYRLISDPDDVAYRNC